MVPQNSSSLTRLPLIKWFGVFLITAFSFSQAKGQSLILFGETYYGSFEMTTLTNLLSDVNSMNSETIRSKIIYSFPPYWNYHVGMKYKFRQLELGGYLLFSSTGGRLSHGDYSGRYVFDVPVSSYGFGFQYCYIITSNDRFEILFNGKIGSQFNHVQLNEEIKIGSEEQKNRINSQSTNMHIVPGLTPRVIFGPVVLGLSVGYQIDLIAGQLNVDNDKLYSQNGDEINVDWSGYRVGIVIELRLK